MYKETKEYGWEGGILCLYMGGVIDSISLQLKLLGNWRGLRLLNAGDSIDCRLEDEKMADNMDGGSRSLRLQRQ